MKTINVIGEEAVGGIAGAENLDTTGLQMHSNNNFPAKLTF